MGDSGDRPNIRLGMPQDVEKLLADLSSMTFEQYIVHAADPLPKGASRRVERPLLTSPLWLDEDGLQGASAAHGVSTFSSSGDRSYDEIDDSLDENRQHESPPAGKTSSSRPTIKKHTIQGVDASVDIGILTIRNDEFRAVLDAFPQKAGAGVHKGASRQYILRHAEIATGERYTVAILRQVEQGTGEAQHAARDLMEDLAPRLVLVVGIAGGLPSDDVTLGDVVLGTRIHDYTVEAVKAGHEVTYAATGGPIDMAIAAAVVALAGREDELGDWTSGLPSQPTVVWTEEGQIYGPPEWQRELRAKLKDHYGGSSSRRAPTYVSGPIASSDRLVKDPTVLFPWITTARNLLAVEMESGGVYRAARDRCPMLPIRGISDIVGLKRADAWTKFACASAAAFARAFLRTRPVPFGVSPDAADPR
jgi:nucleoside phosphorylase